MQFLYLIISLVVVLADQGLKNYIVAHYAVGEVHQIIPGLLSFNYLQNNGAAWNILTGQMWLFYIISIIAISVCLYFLFNKKYKNTLFDVGLALILGGIVGNFIDRLHLKYVVDMLQLDFVHFNIFNIADSAITVGVILVFIYLIFIEGKEENNMTKEYSLEVKNEKGRLDKFVSEQIPDLSRTRVKELVKDQNILVNGKVEKVSYKIQAGDKIEVNIPAVKPLDVIPENIPLDIVYEDDDVIVVNKPQGMVVHPAPGHPDHTLVNALLYHTKALAQSPEGFRPGIVHRIDKDTSGLLMIAKTAKARESLEDQLAHKTNKRLYWAIVHGNFAEENGVIDAPIGRNPYDRKKMAVVETGKKAITHFKVLEQFKDYSLIECQLETGRTHQIRVHLDYIGHPVAGDPLYGPRKTLKGHGQFLHAKVLGFKHPSTGEWLEFSVEPPQIFQETLAQLEQTSK